MIKRIAACSCGQLTETITADPIRVSICHCTDCQRRTGSVFGAQARFRREAVQVAGSSTPYVRTGDEGRKATFSFCPHCGAIVHYQVKGDDQTMAIPVGAFAEPGFPVPTVSVWEEDKHPWVSLPENIEHIWQSTDVTTRSGELPSATLRAIAELGGVQATFARNADTAGKSSDRDEHR